jgi:hypothetical protein
LVTAAESGNCSDGDVFSTYASQADLDAQIAQERSNKDMLREAGIDEGASLAGPNWIINMSDDVALEKLRADLGGTLIR